MSSRTRGLHNLDYVARYEEILSRNLPEGFTHFADFFAGTDRLTTMAALFDDHVKSSGLEVLNVGSGPFASEIFVGALQGQSITALDYTPEFEPFYRLFQAEGHLATTEFLRADVTQKDFEVDAYDLIILHDIFYEKALDLYQVLERLKPALKPGGLLFFDFVNARTHWLWRLMGKPDHFRRYDPKEIRTFLCDAGFDVLEWQGTHVAKSLPVNLLHKLLAVFGTSNNFAVLVRNAESS